VRKKLRGILVWFLDSNSRLLRNKIMISKMSWSRLCVLAGKRHNSYVGGSIELFHSLSHMLENVPEWLKSTLSPCFLIISLEKFLIGFNSHLPTKGKLYLIGLNQGKLFFTFLVKPVEMLVNFKLSKTSKMNKQ
jgi:hypothetical protein